MPVSHRVQRCITPRNGIEKGFRDAWSKESASMNDDFPSVLTVRARRLSRIVAHAAVTADFPLLKVIPIPEVELNRLQSAVAIYLWQSLSYAFPDGTFSLGETLATRYSDAILALPNRTPNGLILPRRETCQSFNLVHQSLANSVQSVGLNACFSAFQMPCNVRVIGGATNENADRRSYSSAKRHTDVWNGEPLSSILFNIPVLGDTEAADLRFFEPEAFPQEFQTLLDDYSLGGEIAKSAHEYPARFQLGSIYLSDSLSLHQTVKRSSALRVSLDFRTIAAELLPGESDDRSLSRAIYVSSEVWKAGGVTTVLVSGEPLDAFQRRQAGERVVREKISTFDIDDAPAERTGR
jgi:hypothetical protein